MSNIDLNKISQILAVKIGEEQQIRKNAIEAIDAVKSIVSEIPDDLFASARQYGVQLDFLNTTDFEGMKESPQILENFQKNLVNSIDTLLDLIKPYLEEEK